MCLDTQNTFVLSILYDGTVSCQIYSGDVRRWSLPFLLVSEILNVGFIWKSGSGERGMMHLNYSVE